MRAKEMFEELGYKCLHYNISGSIKWVTYQIDCGLSDTKRKRIYKNISFNKYHKEKTEISINKVYKNIITGRLKTIPMTITDSEVKAINKQIEELGWNE